MRHIGLGGVVIVLALVAPGTALAQHEGVGPPGRGEGTDLEYRDCYEHVGGFRIPISQVAALGGELPAGFQYRTFDPAGTIGQLVVVGLECEYRGARVTDVFINAAVVPPAGLSSMLLRVRSYTSRPDVAARFAQWCFGDVVDAGEVSAEVTISATGRAGRVLGSDGEGSIELLTATGAAGVVAPAATIRHFTVKDEQVHGLVEFSADAGIRLTGTGPTSAQLVIDGGVAISGFTGQHVFPSSGEPFTFIYGGVTACPPGLDWTN